MLISLPESLETPVGTLLGEAVGVFQKGSPAHTAKSRYHSDGLRSRSQESNPLPSQAKIYPSLKSAQRAKGVVLF